MASRQAINVRLAENRVTVTRIRMLPPTKTNECAYFASPTPCSVKPDNVTKKPSATKHVAEGVGDSIACRVLASKPGVSRPIELQYL